jgi:hypothetical protein
LSEQQAGKRGAEDKLKSSKGCGIGAQGFK